ncbi:class I SAM-dependent methyltransferase [Flavobacterium sp.]|uniref:THUMP-like domain-containing protein n=1 Tax=Flavobacterium sp. TaxID=239 RepID=UPI00260F327E|nr:class I SAM-dependent methyltransferase [Flavobacterium sp.]
MEASLLSLEIQSFIDDHIDADLKALAFQRNPFPETNWIEILNQIAAKTKAKTKLPTWFNTADIYYPSRISVEQTSSEQTAAYKSEIVSGESLIDLSGGFGVDDYYFAKVVSQVIHCEINPELSSIVAHNFKQLHADNITCISGNSHSIIQNSAAGYDWIYVDPSRRNDVKGKVFMLKDCLPNVPELLDTYFLKSDKVLIKTAPLLDISAGGSELKHIKRIHVVALENEVKELLWELNRNHRGSTQIKTVNLNKDGRQVFAFDASAVCHAPLSIPKKYLYEPNSAIMKSGGFDAIAVKYKLEKLHRHSHLYTSDEIKEFPGRIFEVLESLKYDKTTMKTKFERRKINISTRNFPETVDAIRKKWKIKDGGNDYCFFTTDADNNKIALICAKITRQ